jgi:hypothetical protein
MSIIHLSMYPWILKIYKKILIISCHILWLEYGGIINYPISFVSHKLHYPNSPVQFHTDTATLRSEKGANCAMCSGSRYSPSTRTIDPGDLRICLFHPPIPPFHAPFPRIPPFRIQTRNSRTYWLIGVTGGRGGGGGWTTFHKIRFPTTTF